MKRQGGGLCDYLEAKAKIEEVQYCIKVLNFFFFCFYRSCDLNKN